MRWMAGALSVMIGLGACGDSGVVVEDAWARSSPTVADTAAVYLTIANDSSEEEVIVGADSDRCDSMQIHETAMVGDVMEMRRLEELLVPAGRAVQMEPGGLHLMCLGVNEPLVLGDTFIVDLESRGGSSLTFEVVVEDR